MPSTLRRPDLRFLALASIWARRWLVPIDYRVRRSDMTEPDNASPSPRSRDDELEDAVDELEQEVTEEREAQGVPGNASEREHKPPKGSEEEQPD